MRCVPKEKFRPAKYNPRSCAPCIDYALRISYSISALREPDFKPQSRNTENSRSILLLPSLFLTPLRAPFTLFHFFFSPLVAKNGRRHVAAPFAFLIQSVLKSAKSGEPPLRAREHLPSRCSQEVLELEKLRTEHIRRTNDFACWRYLVGEI